MHHAIIHLIGNGERACLVIQYPVGAHAVTIRATPEMRQAMGHCRELPCQVDDGWLRFATQTPPTQERFVWGSTRTPERPAQTVWHEFQLSKLRAPSARTR